MTVHVRDGVLEPDGDFALALNGVGEAIRLQPELVDCRELDGLDTATDQVATVVDKHLHRSVVRRIEGNLELDPCPSTHRAASPGAGPAGPRM